LRRKKVDQIRREHDFIRITAAVGLIVVFISSFNFLRDNGIDFFKNVDLLFIFVFAFFLVGFLAIYIFLIAMAYTPRKGYKKLFKHHADFYYEFAFIFSISTYLSLIIHHTFFPLLQVPIDSPYFPISFLVIWSVLVMILYLLPKTQLRKK